MTADVICVVHIKTFSSGKRKLFSWALLILSCKVPPSQYSNTILIIPFYRQRNIEPVFNQMTISTRNTLLQSKYITSQLSCLEILHRARSRNFTINSMPTFFQIIFLLLFVISDICFLSQATSLFHNIHLEKQSENCHHSKVSQI